MARRAIKRALQDSGIDLVPTKVPKTKAAKTARANSRDQSKLQALASQNGGDSTNTKSANASTSNSLSGSIAAKSFISDIQKLTDAELDVPLEADFDMDAFEAQLERFDALPPPSGEMPKMPASIASLFSNMLNSGNGSSTESSATRLLESESGLLPGSDAGIESLPELTDSGSDSKDDSSADEDFEEFFDYESLCETPAEGEAQKQPKQPEHPEKRGVPLMLYRDHHTERRVPDIPFNTRNFQRSWSALVEDFDPQTRNTYYQSLYLAAASLKPSSIASGGAKLIIAQESEVLSNA